MLEASIGFIILLATLGCFAFYINELIRQGKRLKRLEDLLLRSESRGSPYRVASNPVGETLRPECQSCHIPDCADCDFPSRNLKEW